MLCAFELTVDGVPVKWIIPVLLVFILPFIRRVPEGSMYLIKSRKRPLNHGNRCVWQPGLHMLIPFSDYVAKVIPLDVQTMQCDAFCTQAHDNGKLQIRLEIRYRITDAEKYTDAVKQPEDSLRSETEYMLQMLLANRSQNDEEISYSDLGEKLTEGIAQSAVWWGLQILSITVKSIV